MCGLHKTVKWVTIIVYMNILVYTLGLGLNSKFY